MTETKTQDSKIDVLLAPVLQRRVEAISKEMATMLMRSSRSVIFNELGDFVTVIFGRDARTLAQTEYAPVIAFGAQPPLERIIQYYGEEIYDGDVVIHNDVYDGGNQTADVGIYMPVFFEGELVAWTASKGHVADIGGSTTGGYNPQTSEVWQEALRIPPLKLHERGEVRRDVWDMLAANIRLDIVMEDLKAMIGACTVGSRRLVEMLERYGSETFTDHMDFVLSRSEQQVRDVIASWPDGVYRGESAMVADGFEPTRRYPIVCELRVDGDEATFDFSDTADQAPGFTNVPPTSARGAVRIAFSMALAAGGVDIPSNDGLFAPVTTKFREGSLLNPHFPAATMFGNQVGEQIVEAVTLAFAQFLPDRVTASWSKLLPLCLVGTDPRTEEQFIVFSLFQRGGGGAAAGADGWDAIGSPGAIQVRSPDPEMFELTTPHLLEYVELLPDSAGEGHWRGGLGTRSAFSIFGEREFAVTIGHDAVQEGNAPPQGLFGGRDGGMNEYTVEFKDGHTHPMGSKEMITDLEPGTRIEMTSGGGGGYGDPHERAAEIVLAEVRDGLISEGVARDVYGVVIDTEAWTIRTEETDARRAAGQSKEGPR